MNFKAACELIADQTLPERETPDTFLGRLRQGRPPIPGQVTSLILALKVVRDSLKGADALDRTLAQSLFLIAYESRSLYGVGRANRVDWPPMLDEDLGRIAIAAYQVFATDLNDDA